jgi:hypothetical protein
MRTIISLLSLLLPLLAAGATIEEDVERYIAIFRGDKAFHPAAAESLGWMGLSEQRLFDVIEQRLIADYPAPSDVKIERQRLAWYIRALGFSGQEKYVLTISRFQQDRDYAVYARHALKDLPDYKKWNPLISNRASFDPKVSDDANRALNMVRSGDFRLKEIGAKRVYYGRVREEPIFEALANEVRATYAGASAANNDEIAWMVKALGTSGIEKYRPVIQEVADKSSDSKLARHAWFSLENFGKR